MKRQLILLGFSERGGLCTETLVSVGKVFLVGTPLFGGLKSIIGKLIFKIIKVLSDKNAHTTEIFCHKACFLANILM